MNPKKRRFQSGGAWITLALGVLAVVPHPQDGKQVGIPEPEK
jgi:hypothetical protein